MRVNWVLGCLIAGLGVFGLVTPDVQGADEGGAAWWWACKRDDFIVRGELTYGDQPDITFTYTYEGMTNTAYYIKAKLKIAEVLYLNPNNRYPDSYRYYLSHMDTDREVLILANRIYLDHLRCCSRDIKIRTERDVHIETERFNADHMIKDEVKVSPMLESIPKGPVVMVLNEDYVFPIGGLVLKAIVPDDKRSQAMELIHKRIPMKETAEPNAAQLPRDPVHSEGAR